MRRKRLISSFLACIFMISCLMISNFSLAFAEEPAEPLNVDFDLLTINWVMNERIVAVVIDMGTDIDASSLDLETFRVYVENRNPNNNAIVADQSLFRDITNVYVNTAPEQTDTPPEVGRYIIIEMTYWIYNVGGVAGSRRASDNYKYIVNYTIYQDKPIETADGTELAPGSVIYNQRDIINELQDKFSREMAGTTPVRMFTPEDTSKPMPLVLLLHGSGQGNGNYDAQMSFHNNMYFAWPEIQEQFPSYVLIPAAYPTNSWDNTKIDNLKAFIDNLIAEGKVDPNRLYITGSSMGGGGTWSFVQRYPNYFAAAVPCCAGASGMNATTAQSIAYLPIWYFCNVNDSLWSSVRTTHNNFSQYFKDYMLTTYEQNIVPELGDTYVNPPHAVWVMAYNVVDDPERGTVIEWMFSKSKIRAIDEVQAITEDGVAPVLPDKVTVQVMNNTLGLQPEERNVVWDEIDPASYTDVEPGTVFTVEGTVEGVYDKKAVATVTVTGEEGVVSFKLSGETYVEVNDEAEYVLSAANMNKIATVTVWFDVDGDFFAGKAVEGLNGFEVLGDIVWQNKGGSLWSGRVTLINLTGGITAIPYTDILKLTLSSKELLGITDVKVTRIDVSGYDDDNKAVYSVADIKEDAVTTEIAPHYSEYDINRDLVVDQLDLTAAQLYYGAREGDDNWDTAKIADVNGDGRVDIEDFILILNNIVWEVEAPAPV